MDAEAIHAITSTPSLTAPSGVGHVAANAPAQASKRASGSNGAESHGAAATAAISTPGQFYSELQALAQNPARFKSVAAQVALLFENAASKASGSEAQVLADLASRFSLAAQTGVLPPPGGAQVSPAAPSEDVKPIAPTSGVPSHFYGSSSSGLPSESQRVEQTFASARDLIGPALAGTARTA
jgi:hypothetical protein